MTSEEGTPAAVQSVPIHVSLTFVQVIAGPTSGAAGFGSTASTGGISLNAIRGETLIQAELSGAPMLALDLFKEVADLRKKVEELAREHETPVLRDLPKEEVMAIVSDAVDKLEKGEAVSPSDIAFEYGILPQLVEESLEELTKEGKLGTRDQRRGRGQSRKH